jgi:hypothetical protein
MDIDGLAGAELVRQGLDDLRQDAHTAEAWLVAIARPRLVRLGIDVPAWDNPEANLYALLEAQSVSDAARRYSALLGRICSFSRGLEQRVAREKRDLSLTL